MPYAELVMGCLRRQCSRSSIRVGSCLCKADIRKATFSAAILFCLFTRGAILSYGQNDLGTQAIELTRTGKFHDAELLWRRLEEQQPSIPAAHNGLAFALMQQGQLDQAASEYEKSLVLDPHQPDIAFSLGVAEFRQGHFSKAIPAFESFEKAASNDPRGIFLLGMSYYGLHDYNHAIQYLQKSVDGDPANIELRKVLAESCLWAKQYTCAMKEYQSILIANPNSVQAHMLIAEVLDDMDRTSEAIKELEQAEQISSDEPTFHFALGYLYYKQHSYDRARSELELQIKSDPGYAQAYLYLGDIALNLNDEITAEFLLKKAIKLQKESRLAYVDLGSIYADQRRHQEALTALQYAIFLDPTQPDAHYRLARLYASLGQKGKATKEFDKTKELNQKKDASLVEMMPDRRTNAR